MSMVLWTIGGIAASILVVLIGVISTPVRFRLFAQSAPLPLFRLEARALAGLAPPLRIADSTAKREKKPKKPKDKSRRKRGGMSDRAPRMIKAAPQLVTGLLSKIRFDRLRINGVFGLGDPAATGELFGGLTPLIYGTAGSKRIFVALRPDFDAARLSGTADATLSVIPAALIPPAIRFAWRSFGPVR